MVAQASSIAGGLLPAASDPVRMAVAFKAAVEAGRAAYEIGLAEQTVTASATSPLTGFLGPTG